MIDIQKIGLNGVAGNNEHCQPSRMAFRNSASSRKPFQARNPNTVPQSLSGSSEGSLHKENAATRLSTLESSNNENNKARINNSSSSNTNSLSYPAEVGSDNGDSSLITHTGAGLKGTPLLPPHLQRSLSAGLVSSTPPLAGSVLTSSGMSSNASQIETDENIVIEEKRRKINGDGYTVHRYLRGRLLGKGGFAKVYLCTALETNKNYAVKVVPKANLVKTRARQKLQTEIKIHRILKHKYICEYKHFFEDKINCYILLELCHNQSMNEMIKRRKRLTEPEAAYYLLQMVDAVEYMHGHCVIHRDLKLGNLFLNKDLVIKVGDLGLATKLESVEEKRQTICGTPNYIAPEVILGTKETRGHSFEVDIWSMGVILYTIIVGKPPYEAKDVKATYQRIIANQYSFPSHIDVSGDAKDLISLMLQSKPEDRPTLLEIRKHQFFTSESAMVPTFLPLRVLHMEPEWTRDEDGKVKVVESTTDQDDTLYRTSSHSALPRPSSTRKCFPFSIKDLNAEPEAGKCKAEYAASERGALLARHMSKTMLSSVHGKSSVLPAFEIFDETEKIKHHHLKSPQIATPSGMDGIISKADALSMSEPKASSEAQSSPRSNDHDSAILYQMLERLSSVLDVTDLRKNSYRGRAPRATSRGGPGIWVTRYVDYTSKYGLGFLLNNGCSGVYFNDSTKTVLEPEGDGFEFIERRKVDYKEPSTRRNDPTSEKYTLNTYPESLEKKVTLLKHFRNYLIEQQKKAVADDVDSVFDSVNVRTEGVPMVYLKKWVRTKHAILFRLSNNTVQIVFYDQTEILLTPDERFVTYVDKYRNRATYFLTDELVGTNPEVAKRIKYSKEILIQLIAGQQKGRPIAPASSLHS